MSKITIGIITPDRFFASWEFTESLIKTIQRYPDIKVDKVSSCHVDQNRNTILNQNRDADILLMVDSDMQFTPEDIAKVIKHIEDGKDFIAGVFNAGHYPHNICIYKGYDEVVRKHQPYFDYPSDSVFEAYATGLGFVAISGRLIKQLEPRPFSRITVNNMELGGDLSFSKRVRDMGVKLWCDSTIKIGHVINKIV